MFPEGTCSMFFFLPPEIQVTSWLISSCLKYFMCLIGNLSSLAFKLLCKHQYSFLSHQCNWFFFHVSYEGVSISSWIQGCSEIHTPWLFSSDILTCNLVNLHVSVIVKIALLLYLANRHSILYFVFPLFFCLTWSLRSILFPFMLQLLFWIKKLRTICMGIVFAFNCLFLLQFISLFSLETYLEYLISRFTV